LTQYNIVSGASLVAGQPEDISIILANLQAIASVINGGIDNANLSPGAAIQPSKIAGYPADATKALKGDGSWGVVGGSNTRIPIALTTPRSTTLAGNAFWTSIGLTAYDWGHWEFVKDVEGVIYGQVMIPPSIVPAATAKIVYSIAANAASGVTRMNCSTKAIADAASFNPATLDDIVAQDVTVPATAYTRKDLTFNLASPPASGSLLVVKIGHEGTHTNDTLAVNTLLLGAYLELT